jgi:hypothetical protein
MYGRRFCGQSSGAPNVTDPDPDPDPLLLLLLLLLPPHADNTIAPVMPVAMSTALRLLNFTIECLLGPLVRGERSGLTAPGSPGGLAACVDTHYPQLSDSCQDTVGRRRRPDPRQSPERQSTAVITL